MSADLFINVAAELERLEFLMRAQKSYTLGTSEHKTPAVNGRPSIISYSGQLTYTRHDGTQGYINADGDSFPEIYKKIADQIK